VRFGWLLRAAILAVIVPVWMAVALFWLAGGVLWLIGKFMTGATERLLTTPLPGWLDRLLMEPER